MAVSLPQLRSKPTPRPHSLLNEEAASQYGTTTAAERAISRTTAAQKLATFRLPLTLPTWPPRAQPSRRCLLSTSPILVQFEVVCYKHLFIPVQIRHQGGWKTLGALMDSGVTINFISQLKTFAKMSTVLVHLQEGYSVYHGGFNLGWSLPVDLS